MAMRASVAMIVFFISQVLLSMRRSRRRIARMAMPISSTETASPMRRVSFS